MKLNRDLLFILLIVAVVGLLYFLSTKTKIMPMPANADHVVTLTRGECLKCHTEETLLQRNHPHVWKKKEVACTSCHKLADATKAQLPLNPQRAVDLARSLQP